jgi:hypothetical protein
MHQMVYERARRLSREEHYDSPQWQRDGLSWWKRSDEYQEPPHAILLIENRNIAVGAVSFSYGRRWSNVAVSWILSFAWVAPEWRRHGVLSRRWSDWRERYGCFLIEPPLSESMEAFCFKHGHPSKPEILSADTTAFHD